MYNRQRNRQDIKGLKMNCTYTMNVRSVTNNGRRQEPDPDWYNDRIISIEFVTSDCKNRQAKRAERDRNFESSRCRRRKARIKRLTKVIT